MRRGDWEDAIAVMNDIASQVQAVSTERRAAAREEAASMLSLLARSPAADLWPSKLRILKLRNGWIAGELFLDNYVRAMKRQAKSGRGYSNYSLPKDLSEFLLMINSRRSLEILSRALDNPAELRVPRKVAALAAECLRGRAAEAEPQPPKQIGANPIQRLRLRLPPFGLSRFKAYSESNATASDPKNMWGVGKVEKESLKRVLHPPEAEDQF
jgi:hypothetical protein